MKKFSSRLIVMALALIMVMSFVGCGESKNPNEPDNPDTPSEMVVDITGRTVCGNEPLAGVTISVVDSRGESYPSTVSGSDGKFEIKDVSYRRSVTVTFVKENYFTKNVELSISDLTSGKNAMGDVAISQPEKRMDLTGKIVGLDGVCGIGGVELKVLGFAAEGVSDATGNFVIENAPIGSEKLVIEAKKDKYATRQVEVDVSDIKDGNIGNIELFIRYESVNGSPGIDFTVTRGETSFKVIYNFTKNIYGPQNIQRRFAAQ